MDYRVLCVLFAIAVPYVYGEHTCPSEFCDVTDLEEENLVVSSSSGPYVVDFLATQKKTFKTFRACFTINPTGLTPPLQRFYADRKVQVTFNCTVNTDKLLRLKVTNHADGKYPKKTEVRQGSVAGQSTFVVELKAAPRGLTKGQTLLEKVTTICVELTTVKNFKEAEPNAIRCDKIEIDATEPGDCIPFFG